MHQIQSRLKKFFSALLGTRAATVYILLFAAAIGIATFIENDFGTSAAQRVVYKTKWFEGLLLLFCLTLINNVIRFRMIENRRWALVFFHLSMIVILIGAGITRYWGYEGMMHIREGDSSNIIISSETYLQFEAIDRMNTYHFDEPVLFASLGSPHWQESYQIGERELTAEVLDFVPNPKQEIIDDPEGNPILKVVFGGAAGREEYMLMYGEISRIRGVLFNFSDSRRPDAFNITYNDRELRFYTNQVYTQTVMATRERDTLVPAETGHMLRLRALYDNGLSSFVFGDFNPSGTVSVTAADRKVKNESMTALKMRITADGQSQEKYVYGKKGVPGQPTIFPFQNVSIAIRYGAKPIELPFRVQLYDFQMERYPGTNSAASYASEVRLIDDRENVGFDYRIFMNNILNYKGFRFFQSSFDQDEKGTYLSVNHDALGTWVSYLGYFLLTLGLIMTFFSRKTRFYQVRQQIQKLREQRAKVASIVLLLFLSLTVTAQKSISPDLETVSREHADRFSRIIVQDHKGRMKPMHTMSRELLRKVARTERLFGLNADQILLNMYSNKNEWLGKPIIKAGKHEQVQELLGVGDVEHLSYKDFFQTDGSYKLREEVRRVYGLQPIDRGTYEKEIMKVDERVNIVSMIFSGSFFKVVPLLDHENNNWISAVPDHGQQYDRTVADKFFTAYRSGLHEAIHTGNYNFVNTLIDELKSYQYEHGEDVIPSPIKIRLELFLNNLNVFNRLALYYFIVGMALLVLLFLSIFKSEYNWRKVFLALYGLVLLGFVFHTVGLGIRWYVSGRAPWSNGYESMIYIAFTSVLAGLIFARKNIGGLAATMILAGSILLVAMLSYLDPEITPLVPVLRSYWLTIHVSLIAGSYGFLMLGAIIGLINLLLMIFANQSRSSLVLNRIKELTYISEITLIGGLVMISIGTYLGGVWANESWGRYWGWDAKETWALVTILVYAFILHMRLVPGLKSLYAFNLATVFGMASVIMTYFGVNYYLSGLHSYAAGDPVPIPNWVYIAVVSVVIIAALAFWRRGVLYKR